MTSLRLADRQAAAAIFVAFAASLWAAAVGPIELLPASMLLALGLSWASMVDLDRFILPDALTLSLTAFGLYLAIAKGPAEALPYVVGAAVGYGSLSSLAFVYRRVRGRSGLGLGDAKLLGAAGAWLGWTLLPATMLVASLSCLTFAISSAALQRRPVSSEPLPFGPHIAGAIWLLWLFKLGGHA